MCRPPVNLRSPMTSVSWAMRLSILVVLRFFELPHIRPPPAGKCRPVENLSNLRLFCVPWLQVHEDALRRESFRQPHRAFKALEVPELERHVQRPVQRHLREREDARRPVLDAFYGYAQLALRVFRRVGHVGEDELEPEGARRRE